MTQEIYIIDDDESSLPIFKELFKDDKEFKFIGVKTEEIDVALKNIPFLIIINEDAIDRDVVEVCKKIRTDEDNKRIIFAEFHFFLCHLTRVHR